MEFRTSCDSVSFATEIQAMLHGFGDCRRPRLDTSIVIQSLVRSQMREILLEAANVARIRSSNQIQLEDVIFTVRSDPIRVQRIVKYLSAKDLSSGGGASATNNSKQGSRVRRVREILYTVDAEGGLLRRAADNDLQDASHLERQKRLERLSKDMDARQYAEFNRSRQVTFLGHKHRFSQKFCVWLTTDSTGKIILADDLVDMSIDQSGLEIFAYLAHELIGYLVDMALIIQKDESGITDPVRRIGNHSTFSPYMSANQNRDVSPITSSSSSGGGAAAGSQLLDIRPLEPHHVREALARFLLKPRPGEWFSKTSHYFTNLAPRLF